MFKGNRKRIGKRIELSKRELSERTERRELRRALLPETRVLCPPVRVQRPGRAHSIYLAVPIATLSHHQSILTT